MTYSKYPQNNDHLFIYLFIYFSTEVPNDATNTEGVDAKCLETMHEPFDKQLVQHLCLVFSDACPNYIKALCRGKVNNNEVLDNLITEILNSECF